MQAIQLSLLALPLQGSDNPLVFNTADPAKATRFREMADNMQPAIDAKKDPAIGQQRHTARRARIAESMQQERILMNPPLEKGQDMQHVYRAYKWLVPGARLVSIVSNSVAFRREKKYQQFRNWLAEVGADDRELPDGAFLESDRPTSVKTRLLVIDKPMSAA